MSSDLFDNDEEERRRVRKARTTGAIFLAIGLGVWWLCGWETTIKGTPIPVWWLAVLEAAFGLAAVVYPQAKWAQRWANQLDGVAQPPRRKTEHGRS